jgi:hypothetical protein
LEVEFRRGYDSFVYQPTEPVFLEQQCPPRTPCTVSFTRRLVDSLSPGTAYKWQARVRANYDWANYTNGQLTCGPVYRVYESGWEQIGSFGPGYFSFRTPKTFSTITSTPRVATATTGSLISGDEASLRADDNQWLQARAVGNPRTVAIEGLIPVSVVREVRDFKVHVSARATRACNFTIDAWSRRANSWVQLRSATLPTQETRYGEISLPGRLLDYLLPDSSRNRSPTVREVKVRARCVRAGTQNYDLLLEQVALTYQLADQ